MWSYTYTPFRDDNVLTFQQRSIVESRLQISRSSAIAYVAIAGDRRLVWRAAWPVTMIAGDLCIVALNNMMMTIGGALGGGDTIYTSIGSIVSWHIEFRTYRDAWPMDAASRTGPEVHQLGRPRQRDRGVIDKNHVTSPNVSNNLISRRGRNYWWSW